MAQINGDKVGLVIVFPSWLDFPTLQTMETSVVASLAILLDRPSVNVTLDGNRRSPTTAATSVGG